MKSSINSPSDNSSNNRMAIVWSVVVHFILVGLLVLGALWTPPQTVEAELWDSASLASAMNQETNVEVEVPIAEPEVNKVPSPNVENKTTDEPAEIKTKVTPKTQPVTQPPQQNSSEQKRSTSTKSNSKAQDILNKTTSGTGAKSGASSSGSGNEDVAGYRSAAKRMIEASAQGLKGKSASVLINVSASGQILGKRIIRSSGDTTWDQRLLSSITRLPPNPPSAAQNNKLTINVQP